MEKKDIRVLALDLDGTLTNDQKVVTPATRAALDAAAAKGVTIVLASGRPTAGIMPLAKELGLDKKGGCILSYNGGAIIDCATGETLYRKQLDAKYVPQLCAFAREQGVVIITYNKQGVVTESPEDEWALKECFTCKLPMQKVEDLAAYVDYPICKMLITLDPARRGEVLEAGRKRFAGEIDLYPSSPFFIEAVPLGVAKDVSLGGLLEKKGYEVRVFDLINPDTSFCYNPFEYVHDDKDVLRLISNLIQNTTPKGSQSSDPFWEKSETALLQALMLYLLHEAPPEEQNFAMIMEMLGSAQVKEEDEDYESPLDILFDRLEMRDPDSIAVKQYHIYKQAAGDICSK